ncbi:MAG: hypothetical protein IID45_02880 [Planctomycetes bacterium]|nr:hypothetical protein [Planctomycetota bacterium]
MCEWLIVVSEGEFKMQAIQQLFYRADMRFGIGKTPQRKQLTPEQFLSLQR